MEDSLLVPDPVMFTRREMVEILPVILSDLQFHGSAGARARTNANIRRALYRYVVRELAAENRFHHSEQVGLQLGLFVKGYARDVQQYLDLAYDEIHDTDFESQFATLIATIE